MSFKIILVILCSILLGFLFLTLYISKEFEKNNPDLDEDINNIKKNQNDGNQNESRI